MRAIKWSLFLQVAFASSVFASDEYWGIYQFKKEISGSNFIFAEYVRRDYDGFFIRRNLDLFRLSYGGKLNEWTYLLGAAYVDFETSSNERRLHQFLIKNTNYSPNISSSVRLGLEQRSFIFDDVLYWRGRIRGQLNLPLIYQVGFSLYDEMLFALNGTNKFYQGLNENRFGVGLRYKTETYEILIFQTYAKIKTLKAETNPQWLQLQSIFTF